MRRAAAVALTLVAALAVAVTLAVPSSRSAIAEFFGIEGSRIERLPTPAAGTPTPLPTATGIETVATPSSLDGAALASGFAPAVPDGYGEPEAVYVVNYAGPAVILHYAEFDLWESRTGGFFGKSLPPELVLHEFTIRGQGAAWISGGGHIVRFVLPDGREAVGSRRTVDRNTLIWRGAETIYRIETDLDEGAAVGIAESLP